MRKIVLTLIVFALIAGIAWAQHRHELKAVPRDQVCMVNNQFMGTEQIPIKVEGKQYYGCCAMCVEKLQGSEAARTAIDPLSGKKIDKSSSFIVAKPDRRVLYFASEKNFNDYQKKQTKEN